MKNAPDFPTVEKGEGALLHLKGGGQLIDAISSWWVIAHGHCEPAVVAAIQEQAERLDQVIFAGFTHEPAEALAHQLVAMTPDPLRRVFFSDDGSTAVEVALKMAIQSWAQQGQPQRNRFLAMSHAYHGDTFGAMSVGGESVFTQAFRDLMFEVVRVDHPTHSTVPLENWIADFDDKLARHETRLAGVILEPLIQGAGGMIVWPEAAVRHMAEACKARGILLIFDEVMTGFGRTGSMFAMDKLGVCPDLVALSKALTGGLLPLSVTLATDAVFAAFLADDRSKTFFHGHSFTANPIACSAASANLSLLKSSLYPQRWRRIEEIHRTRISALPDEAFIADKRMCGTMAAVELHHEAAGYLNQMGPMMYHHALSQGVLLRPLGNVIYLLPPYGISADQLHRCWDVLEGCIARVRP